MSFKKFYLVYQHNWTDGYKTWGHNDFYSAGDHAAELREMTFVPFHYAFIFKGNLS